MLSICECDLGNISKFFQYDNVYRLNGELTEED